MNVTVLVYGYPSGGISFTVAPSISQLSPTSGVAGTLVNLTGANFGNSQGGGTVSFNGIPASVNYWSRRPLLWVGGAIRLA